MSKKICPLCGGNNISKILWGFPAWTPELEAELDSKKIVLGGCCISDNDPSYYCNDCNEDIIYNFEQEELQTKYFEFEIGGYFGGYSRIEVNKTSDAIKARYYSLVDGREEVVCYDITEDEFMKYIHKVYSTYILEWKAEYENPRVVDGTHWSIIIRYLNDEERKWYGSNDYPPLWEKFIKAVNMLELPNVE